MYIAWVLAEIKLALISPLVLVYCRNYKSRNPFQAFPFLSCSVLRCCVAVCTNEVTRKELQINVMRCDTETVRETTRTTRIRSVERVRRKRSTDGSEIKGDVSRLEAKPRGSRLRVRWTDQLNDLGTQSRSPRKLQRYAQSRLGALSSFCWLDGLD